jgi:hypothetical protein
VGSDPPKNEVDRLEALKSFGVLDTPRERAFDDLTRLTSFICGTPMAFIGFLDADRLWFKSRRGWDVSEVPRESLFALTPSCNQVYSSSVTLLPTKIGSREAH